MKIRKKFILVGCVITAVVAMIAVAFFLLARPLTTIVTIVDEAGHPVAGALIVPNGIVSKGGGSHFMWPETGPKPIPMKTDAQGQAVLEYPSVIMEKVELGGIRFEVDHPDYPWQHAEQVVDYSPPSSAPLLDTLEYHWDRLLIPRKYRPSSMVLRAGAMVSASGFVGSSENRVTTNLFADPQNRSNWQTPAPGLLTSRRYAHGPNFLRLVHFPQNGRILFSDVVSFLSVPKTTNQLHLELKPGRRLEVKLDRKVPRPVKDGRVVLWITSEYPPEQNPPIWRTWRQLDTNGICVFDSIPPGKVNVIGICDGFISSDGPPVLKGNPNGRRPQNFTVGKDQEYELEMELPAVCKVRVLDSTQKPLAGAIVSFWPNLVNGGLFARYMVNSEEQLRSHSPINPTDVESFCAITGADGIALIDDLPGAGQEEIFSIEHPEFEMPVDPRSGGWRYGRAVLNSAEISSVTVNMEKRGANPVRALP